MLDDDFRSRLDAYSTASSPDDMPTEWTPEWVGIRMIHAVSVTHRSVEAPGPRLPRTSWPAVVSTWADLVDEGIRDAVIANAKAARRRSKKTKGKLQIDWRQYVDRDLVTSLEAEKAERAALHGDAPLPFEIDLADEALGWPARYLAADQAESDSLQLWALCHALGRNIARTIKRARQEADALIAKRRYLLREEEFGRLVSARVEKPQARSRATEYALAAVITRQDVRPHWAFSEDTLDRRRKHGAALIADRLKRDRVRVR